MLFIALSQQPYNFLLWNMNIITSIPIASHRGTLPIIKSDTLPAMHNLKAEADVEHTACSSTLRSRSSSLLSGVVGSSSKLGSFRSSNNVSSSSPQDQTDQPHNNNRAPAKKRLSKLFSTMKIRTRRWSRRRKTISEPKLRKKLKKHAERGDWMSVKKLLSNHDFADIPIPETFRDNSSHERKSSSGSDKRRPSYGSRNSFSGKESAAAAAAIKAARFDESSSVALSSEIQDVGENVLHDICRCSPPLDVIESLLWSLRHRRGYTTGRDEMGRTPLHVAASYGSSPDVVDALARADPSPASIADVDGRTPLHIAVMYLAYNGNVGNFPPLMNQGVPPSIREEALDEDAHEQLATTILILKTVMTTYPGVVDFKDDDKMGYSPLDYAIDGNITDEHVLHCLLRRKGLKPQRCYSGSSNNTQETNNNNLYRPLRRRSRFDCDSSSRSAGSSQDISVLLRLEEDEIAAHREKVEKLRSERRKVKVKIQSTLFDMFGIDQEVDEEPPRVHEIETEQKEAEKATKQQSENVDQVADTNDAEKPSRRTSRRMQRRKSLRSNFTSSSSRRLRDSDVQNSMGSADIYNAHLDAYLNGLVNEDLEVRDDDDSFDIFHDPEEDVEVPQEEHAELYDAELEHSQPPLFEIDIQFGGMDATLNDDCSQCSFGRSVISEVSVPAMLISRES